MSKHYKGDVSKDEVVEFEVPNVKEQKLSYREIESQMNHLKGQVLTVIDATFPERSEQRKAVKDLIFIQFSNQLNWIYELCGYPMDSESNDKK